MSFPRTLIVGIGSPHGDDRAGWQVAEQLAAGLELDRVVVRQAKTPAVLLDWLEEIDCLVICDACRGLGRVGEVRRWLWPSPELADVSWSGTHNLSLPAVLQLAEQLERLPPSVILWSVEGKSSDVLSAMSPEVGSSVRTMIDNISREVTRIVNTQDLSCTNTP